MMTRRIKNSLMQIKCGNKSINNFIAAFSHIDLLPCSRVNYRCTPRTNEFIYFYCMFFVNAHLNKTARTWRYRMILKNKNIYRQAFFDAQRTNKNGEILIPASLNQSLFLVSAIAVLVAIFLFVSLGSYTRKAKLQGVVMPFGGVIKIQSDVHGYVSNLYVKEGDEIKRGDRLYQVDAEKYDSLGNGVLSALAKSISMQHQILESQKNKELMINSSREQGLSKKISQLKDELESSRSILSLAEYQASLKQADLKRYTKLLNKKYVSELDYQQKRIEFAAMEESVEMKKLSLQRLEREILSTKFELKLAKIQGEVRLTEIDRQLEIIEQQTLELARQGGSRINTPISGTVAAVLVDHGQAVNINTPMLVLVPINAKIQAELFAPSRSIGFIKVGQKVSMRFSAFPYQKFGVQYGKVKKVSKATLTHEDLVLRGPITINEKEALYRIVVELDKTTVSVYGNEESLMVGMTLSADIALDTRQIYEWIIEPLWSLKGRI
ncbi:HlyD family secretion protein [Photobacterium frigidiphilum]|uniref:HlyD family secretion protein n=1 Tax=Photobacterium frigidiphilum TaxID=264736 RepID=UPI003D13EFAB